MFDDKPYKFLIGKTVESIESNPDADEGLIIIFTDGTILSFGYSGCEGDCKIKPCPVVPIRMRGISPIKS